MSKTVTRLFKYIHPTHYDISLQISEDKMTFSGSSTMVCNKVGQPTKRITLHSKGLKFYEITIEKKDKKTREWNLVEIERINVQKKYEELRIHTKEQLYAGEYRVRVDFSGKITDQMDGMYPCRFTIDGEEQKIIATQFESHDARQVFPCVDEPEAKATFKLSLTHNKDETPLSNTDIESTSTEGTQQTTVFHKTPIMSTYLLAFVVGNIAANEARSKSGVLLRTWATPNQAENTTFALENAVKSMDFYEDYYDIPFPLEKCDFVALPDFASGAMENWGLITFREQAMLVDEHTSLSSKQYVAIVVAHELTHQWFGNLVTMQWWTDLWLNEGFASWMEYLAVDNAYPQWHLWTQFAVDDQQIALKLDALEHTHPIEVPIDHPDEIRTIFDAISYQKGASIIHMLHDYLGPEAFKQGLRSYLKENSYKNTVTMDLWAALEKASGKPVKEFMHKWTSKSGYPIVHMEHNNNYLSLTQKRFITNPRSSLHTTDSGSWPIPLSCSDDENSTLQQLFTTPSTNIQLGKNEDLPLKLNIGQEGFYRATYSHEFIERQIDAIKSKKLNTLDRMGLLSDTYEVTKAGYESVSTFLDLVEHFSDEHELATWEIIAGSLSSIRWNLSKDDTDESLRDAINPFIASLVQKQYNRLGWDVIDGEPHLDALLRPVIISMACGAKHKAAVTKASELYKARIEKNQKIHADIRGSVLSTAARNGGLEEFEQMLEMYKASQSSDEKLSLTSALTSFSQAEVHKKILTIFKNQKIIRLQDLPYWVAYSLSNRHSKKATWKWVQENWEWLESVIGTDLSFYRMPVYVARNFASEDELNEFKEFFGPRLNPSIQRSYDQGIEIIETATDWRMRDNEIALMWFANRNS